MYLKWVLLQKIEMDAFSGVKCPFRPFEPALEIVRWPKRSKVALSSENY
jgi:hypothetical protein